MSHNFQNVLGMNVMIFYCNSIFYFSRSSISANAGQERTWEKSRKKYTQKRIYLHRFLLYLIKKDHDYCHCLVFDINHTFSNSTYYIDLTKYYNMGGKPQKMVLFQWTVHLGFQPSPLGLVVKRKATNLKKNIEKKNNFYLVDNPLPSHHPPLS